MSVNKLYLPLLFGGGALRPAATQDILQWLRGVDPDGITILDKKDLVNPEPEVRDVNCLLFNGSQLTTVGTDNSAISRTGIFDFSFWAKRDADSTQTVLTGGGAKYDIDFLTSNRIRVLLYNSSGVTYTGGQLISLGVDTMQVHFYRFIGDGSKVDIYVDDVYNNTITYDGNFDGTANAGSSTVGKASSGFSGYLSQFCIEDNTTESFALPMEEGSLLPYDASGNSNHPSANTAVR